MGGEEGGEVMYIMQSMSIYSLYDETSISAGRVVMLTSNLSWTELRILASVSSDTKVTDRPLVPNLPARATYTQRA